MTGIQLIAAERTRQIEDEGFDAEHDDRHDERELIDAAVSYVVAASYCASEDSVLLSYAPAEWPWRGSEWKPSDDPIRNLVKAGALIAAEIDRLQRKAQGILPKEETTE